MVPTDVTSPIATMNVGRPSSRNTLRCNAPTTASVQANDRFTTT